MANSVRIQLLDQFLIYIDEERVENPVSKTRKGAALMAYLIMNRGHSVPSQRLLRALWSDWRVSNPENALKTLVSRVRSMLNGLSDGLGGCIVSERGAYGWRSMDNVRVDVLEWLELNERVAKCAQAQERRVLYDQMLRLYSGDLYQTGCSEDEAAFAQDLHGKYLAAVYEYIALLQKSEDYNEISGVCRRALDVDSFDERLHIELMRAMVNLDRPSDAMDQYAHATGMITRYLGAPPSDEMKAFYRQMNQSRKTLKFNLDVIKNDLKESGAEPGAFVCEYAMFKEIYNLQMRNLERLGSTMFLGIIMIGEAGAETPDSPRLDAIIAELLGILRRNLRKGDIITRYAPSIVALLLPTANYETGHMIMERIRQVFYKSEPNSSITFHYRLGMLGKKGEEAEAAGVEDEGTEG